MKKPDVPKRRTWYRTVDVSSELTTLADILDYFQNVVDPASAKIHEEWEYYENHPKYYLCGDVLESDEDFDKRIKLYEKRLEKYNKWYEELNKRKV